MSNIRTQACLAYPPLDLSQLRMARQYLHACGETNNFCIMCGRAREFDLNSEPATHSHLFPDSVLRLFPKMAAYDTTISEQISFKQYSYMAFCKFRNDRVSCEDVLSELGEVSFASGFVSKFAAVDDLKNEYDRLFTDPKIYHCIVSIAWRLLALSLGPNIDQTTSDFCVECLEHLRPFVCGRDVNLDGRLIVAVHVVGRKTMCAWQESLIIETDCSVEPLIGNVIATGLPTMREHQSVKYLLWKFQIGPLHFAMTYSNTFVQDYSALGLLGLTRVPPSGKFEVLGFSKRPAMHKEMFNDIIKSNAVSYSLAYRSRKYHWIQDNCSFLLLVGPEYGEFDEMTKVLTMAESYQLVDDSRTTLGPSNASVKAYAVYRDDKGRYFLLAHFQDGPQEVISVAALVRSSATEVDLIPKPNHAEKFGLHKERLLQWFHEAEVGKRVEIPLHSSDTAAATGPAVVDFGNVLDVGDDEEPMLSMFV
jgi:hypothetical protein